MSNLKEMHSTLDTPKPLEKARVKRIKPEPTVDTPDRRKAVESRLAEIPELREKHKKSLLECTELRRTLEKNLEKIRVERTEEVDQMLEKVFVEGSTKKTLDKVLKLEMKEPKLNQLQDNIEKLKAQELWIRGKSRELSTEERALRTELNDFRVNDLCRDIQAAVDSILSSLEGMQPVYAKMLCYDIHDLQGIEPKFYFDRLLKSGCPRWIAVFIMSHFKKILSRVGRS